MSIEGNKAIVRRICEEIYNQGHLAVADEVIAADCVEHVPGSPPGPEGLKRFLSVLRTAFPDLQVTLEDLIGEADKVTWRWALQGTHQGEFFGLPATGKHARWAEIQIGRFADEKLVEHWNSIDRLELLEQLGVAPQAQERSPE